MAFPGGHWEQGDADLAATAMRETHEEIGLDLARRRTALGHLDYMNVNPIGTSIDMLIVPFVFAVDDELPPLQPYHEVAAVLWGSVPDMFHGRSATRRDMHVRGGVHPFAGYDIARTRSCELSLPDAGFFAVLDPEWQMTDWRPRHGSNVRPLP